MEISHGISGGRDNINKGIMSIRTHINTVTAAVHLA